MFRWPVRFLLALAAVALAVLALGGRPGERMAPSVVVPAPRASSEPFVERVTSRLARETQPPYPTSTPLPDGSGRVSEVDFGYMPSVVRIRVGQTVVWR